MAEVTIEWDRLRPVGTIIREHDSDENWGVYQAHGPHRVYGGGGKTLLYIGRTDNFSKRFLQHLNAALGLHFSEHGVDPENMSVRRGRIVALSWGRAKTVSDEHLAHVEAALIRHYKPAMNTQNIRKYGGPVLTVRNTGVVRPLTPEFVIHPD